MWPKNRTSYKKYNLAKIDYRYLTRRDASLNPSKNTNPSLSKIERRIEKKAKNLDKRIQYLIEDLVLLDKGYNDLDHSNSDHTPDFWSDSWNGLVNLNRHDEPYNPPFHLFGMGVDSIDLENIKVGMNFGHILYLIRRNTDSDASTEEIVLGFLLGVCGQGLDQSALESGKETETAPVDRSYDEKDKYLFEVSGKFRSALNKCVELMPQMEAVPSEELRADFLRVVEEEGFRITPPLFDGIREIAEGMKFEHEGNLMRQLDTGTYIYPIIGMLEDNEKLTRSREMADTLNSDIDHLENTYWRDADLYQIDVFRAVSHNEPISRAKLKQEVGAADQLVGKLLNDLLGNGRSPENWEERPVIQEKDECTTTDYGKLIAEIWEISEQGNNYHGVFSDIPFRDEPIIAVCHAYGLQQMNEDQEKLFSNALNEIDSQEELSSDDTDATEDPDT